jgi:hypothetical protein
MAKKKTPIPAIIVCTLILICCPPTPGKIIYVDDDAPTGGDGRSWQTAPPADAPARGQTSRLRFV